MAMTLPAAALPPSPPWPALREELRLSPGPVDANGQPTWTLHDPVRHRFLRIDWMTWEILRHWWLGDARLIADEIGRRTTLQIGPEDVAEVLALARREELVLPTNAPPARTEAPAWRRGLQWLLHNYLFFRVPLLRPERLLNALLPWLLWAGQAAFTRLTGLALLGGLFGIAQHGEALQAQWLDMLSWRGLLLYGGTLCAVKLAHEFGHALVARHHGCRVPTMGVAFMVLWPVAYTDTTEAWRLADRRARMRIAAAGVRTELTLAAWATLAWTLLPDGPLRTAAFVLGTMTWVSSVLINLSPFMRFDGYFLLCDALDLPNLHERSFAQARAWLRRSLLGWEQAPPEHFAAGPRAALIAFALTTWAWRLMLYLGIAWTVYAFGFKLLGLTLLLVELGWFIAAPVVREIAHWRHGWPEWRGRTRARFSFAGLVALAGLAFVPWSHPVTGAALVQPAQTLAVRLPAAVRLDGLDLGPGSRVRQGEVLLRASTPALERQAAAARAGIVRLEHEVATATVDTEQRARWGALQAELGTAREQAHAADEAHTRLQPVAPFDAVVVDVLPGLVPGAMTPGPSEALMHLASTGRWSAVAYVDELTARTLQPGQTARIGLDARPTQRWPAHVQSVAAQPSSLIAEPVLVQAHGGLLDARDTPQGWAPTQTQYRVVLVLDEALPLAPRSWRGHVVIEAPPDSLAARAWREGMAFWMREAGF